MLSVAGAIPLPWALGVGLGAPLLAFVGSGLGTAFGRRGDRELDVWRRREETMRLLRWAAELAADPAGPRRAIGLSALAALDGSELLQPADAELVATVARGVITSVGGAYAQPTTPDPE